MSVLRWAEATREALRATLPDALVVVPVGAVEQHGPHLPTGTDTLLVTTVAERAADVAAGAGCPRPLVLAPAVTVGVSEHHVPFGGTLSLAPDTLLAVLLDLARSVAAAGGERLVWLNGHGGNRGTCRTATQTAAARLGLRVAYADYWDLGTGPADAGVPVPGHAGAFETGLVGSVAPELVVDPPHRPDPPAAWPEVAGVSVDAAAYWAAADGYTDDPAAADPGTGARQLAARVAALADRFTALARVL